MKTSRIRVLLYLTLAALGIFLIFSACDKLITETIETTISGFPTANFVVQPDSCCRPCSIQFTDNSNGPRHTYIWSFGDGDSSTAKDPIHYYTSEGQFNITLLIRDTVNGNEDNEIKLNYVNIIDTLNSDFTASVDSCCLPCSLQFFDNSYTCNGLVYVWDFGDGDSSTAESPIHYYDSAGIFDVSLFVRDTLTGNQDTELKLGYIYIIDSLDADFTASVDSCCLPCSLQFFDNSYSCNEPVYVWDFGDGDSSTAKDPIHYYTTAGLFDVTLQIEDTLTGNQDTELKLGYIYIIDSLDADFTASVDSCCLPCSLQFFDNSYSCNEPVYVWDFGDGDSSAAKDPVHIYDSAGSFDVSLFIIDTISGNQDTETKLNFIHVIDTLVDSVGADFSVTPPTGDTSITFTFTELTQGEVTGWFWDFGDNLSSTAESPTHNYDSAGTYLVRMILSSPCDSVEKIKTLIVTN